MLRVWIGGWRHVEHLDPTKAHTGCIALRSKSPPNDLFVGTPCQDWSESRIYFIKQQSIPPLTLNINAKLTAYLPYVAQCQ